MQKGMNNDQLRISKEFLKLLNGKARKPASDETINMLSELFNGASQNELANKYNITQQAISRAKIRMEKLYYENQALRKDLTTYTVDLHPSLTQQFEKLLEKNEALLQETDN